MYCHCLWAAAGGGGRAEPSRMPPTGSALVAVRAGQRRPQAAGRRGTPTAEHPGHDAARGPFHGKPELDFALATANKRSHIVKFERFRLLLLGLFQP